jgi:hypothetical protein
MSHIRIIKTTQICFDRHQGASLILVMERYVEFDIPLHTRQHVKQMNVCCRITTFTTYEDLNFN